MPSPNADDAANDPVDTPAPDPRLRLGFVRGVAPSKWAKRWAEAVPTVELELVPLPLSGRPDPAEAPLDVLLERVLPGGQPELYGPGGPRHALRLYRESVALVVPVDHELAKHASADRDALALIPLLAHPDHAAEWPAPVAWEDPAWAPADAAAALELVAAGTGAILLPLPLARHLSSKRAHAVLPVHDDAPLPGTEIWATWSVARDAGDIQQLVGIMRGRTARSQRSGAADDAPAGATPPARTANTPAKKKPQLPKNSRGAQLQAAQQKREAAKRARAQHKRHGR